MRRREFLGGLAGASAMPALGLHAQQKPPTIGFLGTGAAAHFGVWVAAFEARLQELGWTKGRTVAIEYRWGEGRPERFAEVAAEFVRLKVDVVVTLGSAVPAFKRATSQIPIVFAVATDPVGGGLIASLARPGANITGTSNQQSEVASKRIGLFREILPNFRRLGVLANAGHAESVLEMNGMRTVARDLGIDVVPLEIRRADDLGPAFDRLGKVEALYVVADGLMNANRTRIFTLALGARLPTICTHREYAAAGGLMSYGPNYPALFRRAADFTDRILRGAKPGDLPVEQPTAFDLVINLTTAKAIGLTIPQSILLRADEIIE